MKLNWKRAKSDIEQRSSTNEDDKPVVLLVDDEELNLRLMGQLLEKYFKVYTAKSGLEAIKLLNTPNLSVIISDQRMPQMTGVELFEIAVRQAHPASRILLTGYADAQNVVQAINAGHIYRYLEKPIPEDALVAAVRKAVSLYERNQQLRNDVTSLKKEIRRSVEILERQANDNPRLGMMISNIGETRMMAADFEGAKTHFRRAITEQERTLGPTHPDLGLALTNLAHAQALTGEAEDALETLDRAATVFTATGTEHPTYAHVLATRGEAELLLGRNEQAVEHFEGAMERLEKTPGLAVVTDLAGLRFGLARALVEVGREPGRARQLAKDALAELDAKPSVPMRTLLTERIDAWMKAHTDDLDVPGQPLMRD